MRKKRGRSALNSRVDSVYLSVKVEQLHRVPNPYCAEKGIKLLQQSYQPPSGIDH